jgi:hypothetical protein
VENQVILRERLKALNEPESLIGEEIMFTLKKGKKSFSFGTIKAGLPPILKTLTYFHKKLFQTHRGCAVIKKSLKYATLQMFGFPMTFTRPNTYP